MSGRASRWTLRRMKLSFSRFAYPDSSPRLSPVMLCPVSLDYRPRAEGHPDSWRRALTCAHAEGDHEGEFCKIGSRKKKSTEQQRHGRGRGAALMRDTVRALTSGVRAGPLPSPGRCVSHSLHLQPYQQATVRAMPTPSGAAKTRGLGDARPGLEPAETRPWLGLPAEVPIYIEHRTVGTLLHWEDALGDALGCVGEGGRPTSTQRRCLVLKYIPHFVALTRPPYPSSPRAVPIALTRSHSLPAPERIQYVPRDTYRKTHRLMLTCPGCFILVSDLRRSVPPFPPLQATTTPHKETHIHIQSHLSQSRSSRPLCQACHYRSVAPASLLSAISTLSF